MAFKIRGAVLAMELQAQIARWVDCYNNERYQESLGNITPRDKYLGRAEEGWQNRRCAGIVNAELSLGKSLQVSETI